jgi:hypothetical protein
VNCGQQSETLGGPCEKIVLCKGITCSPHGRAEVVYSFGQIPIRDEDNWEALIHIEDLELYMNIWV